MATTLRASRIIFGLTLRTVVAGAALYLAAFLIAIA
jgi:hypothetical protein